MNRSSVFSPNRVFTALASLVLALIVGAAAIFLSRQAPIPVTGAVEAAAAVAGRPNPTSLELGAGYQLQMVGTQGRIVAPAAPAVSARQSIDLGSGYRLEMTGSQGQVVAPVRSTYERINIGSGHWLELVNGKGAIVSSGAPSKAQPVPFASKLDIGSGYTLEMTGAQGKIVAPAQSEADAGKVFWMENGQVVYESTR